jgi:glycerophosphoryl diester phosphodiesterase
LYPELKTPELYEGRDVQFEELVAAALDKHALRGPNADPRTALILQTFGEESARTLARMKIGVPVVLLIGGGAWDESRIHSWKGVVQGFGPAKGLLLKNARFVEIAHAAGFTVTPYTFSSSGTGTFSSVKAEMEHFLYTLGVDALFTDNPDQFPRR